MRIFLYLCIVLLSACASRGTTVVLLEGDGAAVGAVRVSTASGTQELTMPRQATTVRSQSSKPSAIRLMEREEIGQEFGRALYAMPAPPKNFVLYFVFGTTRLTPASERTAAEVLAEVGRRKAPDVHVNGHTDRVGKEKDNQRLSLKRAEIIRDLLVRQGLDPANIQLYGYGETVPLVPTEDGVDEPRNRRVEVIVR